MGRQTQGISAPCAKALMFPDLPQVPQPTQGPEAKPKDKVSAYLEGLSMKELTFFSHGDKQYTCVVLIYIYIYQIVCYIMYIVYVCI